MIGMPVSQIQQFLRNVVNDVYYFRQAFYSVPPLFLTQNNIYSKIPVLMESPMYHWGKVYNLALNPHPLPWIFFQVIYPVLDIFIVSQKKPVRNRFSSLGSWIVFRVLPRRHESITRMPNSGGSGKASCCVPGGHLIDRKMRRSRNGLVAEQTGSFNRRATSFGCVYVNESVLSGYLHGAVCYVQLFECGCSDGG